MIEETATVVEGEGEFVWLETDRKSACGHCASSAVCGTSVLARVLGQRLTRVRALNRAQAAVGDTVVVGVPDDALVRGSLVLYAVPLAGLLAGALLGEWAGGGGPGEGSTILGAVVGLAVGFYLVARHARGVSRDARFQPVVLRRVPAVQTAVMQRLDADL